MRPFLWRGAVTLLTVGCLSACVGVTPAPSIKSPPPPIPPPSSPPPLPSPQPSGPAPSPPSPANPFNALVGWDLEDHAAALAAFQSSCGAVPNPSLEHVCARAMALGPVDERLARAFLERSFRPELIAGDGLLTGYFAPDYEAREAADSEFSAPVRPRPADLPEDGAGPYPDRAAIEATPAPDALAWMRPEDLFFLQIQGSGTLIFGDGRRLMAVSDGVNGAPFVGIAKPMRAAGLLSDEQTSGQEIHAWLAAHRGAQAKSLMDLDPRYAFFRLRPDDGRDPAGAARVPLPPGRAVAVDLDRHALGELLWIDAQAPALIGAFPVYRRLVVALDTGGAIKGDVRADLYLGRGEAAGVEAGRVRHRLRLYRLAPVDP